MIRSVCVALYCEGWIQTQFNSWTYILVFCWFCGDDVTEQKFVFDFFLLDDVIHSLMILLVPLLQSQYRVSTVSICLLLSQWLRGEAADGLSPGLPAHFSLSPPLCYMLVLYLPTSPFSSLICVWTRVLCREWVFNAMESFSTVLVYCWLQFPF